MILSLATSENIPLIEARRKIQQSIFAPADIRYDFRNFFLLNSKRSSNDNSRNNHSDIQSVYLQFKNRFSVLSSSNTTEGTIEGISSNLTKIASQKSGSSPRDSHKIKKLSFSQKTSSLNGMSAPRPHARTHEVAKVNSFVNLLCFPNGRTPNISGNGVGYNNHTDSDF